MPDYYRHRVSGWRLFLHHESAGVMRRFTDTVLDVLRATVKRRREERAFHIDAWVVLPDHMHCIITSPLEVFPHP